VLEIAARIKPQFIGLLHARNPKNFGGHSVSEYDHLISAG